MFWRIGISILLILVAGGWLLAPQMDMFLLCKLLLFILTPTHTSYIFYVPGNDLENAS
jgi:hypothetical protein